MNLYVLDSGYLEMHDLKSCHFSLSLFFVLIDFKLSCIKGKEKIDLSISMLWELYVLIHLRWQV